MKSFPRGAVTVLTTLALATPLAATTSVAQAVPATAKAKPGCLNGRETQIYEEAQFKDYASSIKYYTNHMAINSTNPHAVAIDLKSLERTQDAVMKYKKKVEARKVKLAKLGCPASGPAYQASKEECSVIQGLHKQSEKSMERYKERIKLSKKPNDRLSAQKSLETSTHMRDAHVKRLKFRGCQVKN